MFLQLKEFVVDDAVTVDGGARANTKLETGKTYARTGQRFRRRLLTILSDGSIRHGDAAGNGTRMGVATGQSTRFRRRRRRY